MEERPRTGEGEGHDVPRASGTAWAFRPAKKKRRR
jgi:hypothetical protein